MSNSFLNDRRFTQNHQQLNIESNSPYRNNKISRVKEKEDKFLLDLNKTKKDMKQTEKK